MPLMPLLAFFNWLKDFADFPQHWGGGGLTSVAHFLSQRDHWLHLLYEDLHVYETWTVLLGNYICISDVCIGR
jgi:hypothetical protein